MRQHWFILYFPFISRGAQFVIWITGAGSWVTAAWEEYPLPWLLYLMTGSAAMASVFSYCFLKIGDYLFEQAADAQMGRAFAEALEDRITVGHTQITARQAADMWDDVVPPEHGLSWNTKFRWIKNSVDNEHVHGEPRTADGTAFENTVMEISELAAFFRRRGWKKLATSNKHDT